MNFQKKSYTGKKYSALASLLIDPPEKKTVLKKSTSVAQRFESDCGIVRATTLKDSEYVYLNAVELGENEIVKQLLLDPELNPNVMDYMGRNALLLAMRSENLSLIEVLIDKMEFELVEDALINAIGSEEIHLVKLMIDNQNFIRNEQAKQRNKMFSKPTKVYRSQYPADITPIMLAAHSNNHEVIQLLLDRGHKLDMPHERGCLCENCENLREKDSLMLELKRLHTYMALASPAYLSLTTSDPVASAFMLRNELYTLAQEEKQFKTEYTKLALQSMDFALNCLDLCRTSDEVHSLLSGRSIRKGREVKDPLATVKLAINCKEKKFVAHSNCQHLVESIFYGNMIHLRDMDALHKFYFFSLFVPLLPILYVIHCLLPNVQIPVLQVQSFPKIVATKMRTSDLLRCPIIKFIGHMTSYFIFLLLITVATFKLNVEDHDPIDANWSYKAHIIKEYDFRGSDQQMNFLQMTLVVWIFGQLLMECKQVYFYGLTGYFRSYYNLMDSLAICLYLASFSMLAIVEYKVQVTKTKFGEELDRAYYMLNNESLYWSDNCNYTSYRNQLMMDEDGYWLRGCRLWWVYDDPQLVSDCMFAVANVLSFSKVTYLMPAWELLGPLQISLGRMVSDITKFMFLFFMMVFAFVVGLTNLYWYFAKVIIDVKGTINSTTQIRYGSKIPAFQSSLDSFYTLYWALFGQSSNNSTMIDEESIYPGHDELKVADSAFMISKVGSIMYGIYNAAMIIILLNMLIAMMSKSFDEIQGFRLEEWKFARAILWMVYMEQEDILPVPFNLIPQRDRLSRMMRHVAIYLGIQRNKLNRQKAVRERTILKHKLAKYKQMVVCGDEQEDLSTIEMKGNMIRRYLFQLQKQKDEENKSGDMAMLRYQRERQEAEAAKKAAEAKSDQTGDLLGIPGQPAANRGLSSLLMPPSVRRKIEQEIDKEETQEMSKKESTPPPPPPPPVPEPVIEEAIVEVNPPPTPSPPPPPTQPVMKTIRYPVYYGERDGFTARTEMPLKDQHLRELSTLEREAQDFSDYLDSSCSDAPDTSESDDELNDEMRY